MTPAIDINCNMVHAINGRLADTGRREARTDQRTGDDDDDDDGRVVVAMVTRVNGNRVLRV